MLSKRRKKPSKQALCILLGIYRSKAVEQFRGINRKEDTIIRWMIISISKAKQIYWKAVPVVLLSNHLKNQKRSFK